MTRLTHEPIDHHALTDAVRRPGCGGVVLFLGTVRDLTGDTVTAFLDYDAYAPMAEKKLAEIEAAVRTQWPVGDVQIVHRLGRLAVNDVSVAVAVSCPHRKDAFAACQFAIDTLKETVPIWKKDIDADGKELWMELVPPMLMDSYQRVHNNLRISVTDRCNLRCTYCMPEEVTFLPRSELLSFEEMAKFVAVAAPLGIDKIRLTGGEPLMRKNLDRLVELLIHIPGIHDIGLTTNGLLLADQAHRLYRAGLRRLNVSLDTLDAGRFHELSRRDGLDAVIVGLMAAKAAGFSPIKVNAVAIRGYAEHDIVPLTRFCLEHDFEMRFIEYMPIGAESWERQKCFFAHEILEILERDIGPLNPASDYDPHAPAMEFAFAAGGTVGIIASVSRPFCRSCNRLRLTADGKLRNCLFALDETDVKTLLRAEPFDHTALANAITGNVAAKWEGHEINTAKFVKPLRTMHSIGG